MTIAVAATTPRYNPEVYHEQSLSPIADLHFDVVVLQSEFLAAHAALAEQLAREVPSRTVIAGQLALMVTLQARLNRVSGALTELTQRLELGDKRAKRKTPLREQQGDSSADSSQ